MDIGKDLAKGRGKHQSGVNVLWVSGMGGATVRIRVLGPIGRNG